MNESINKNYYEFSVLETITESPIEFLKLFFKEFEKNIFKISTESKEKIFKNFRENLDRDINQFLDTYNFHDIELKSTSSKSSRNFDILLRMNVKGSNLVYTIKGPHYIETSSTIKLSRLNCNEFFSKFIPLIKENFEKKDYEENDEEKSVININLDLRKYFIKMQSFYKSTIKNGSSLKLRVDLSLLIDDKKFDSFEYAFQYSYLLKALKNFIIPYLNRNNLYITKIYFSSDLIEIFTTFSMNKNDTARNYTNYSYDDVQKAALEEFKDSIKTKKFKDFTLIEFKRWLITSSFNA